MVKRRKKGGKPQSLLIGWRSTNGMGLFFFGFTFQPMAWALEVVFNLGLQPLACAFILIAI